MLPFRYPDKPVETSPRVIQTLSEGQWIAQCKKDGWRMPIYTEADKITCFTSQGRLMADTAARSKFDAGAFLDGLHGLGLPPDTVLDTEFVGPRGGQKPAIYIFDCLAWAGEWLGKTPYKDRWNRCCTACVDLPDGIHLVRTVSSNLLELFNELKAKWIANGQGMDEDEGIVVKSLRGTLHLSRGNAKKSEYMLKLKFRDIKSRRY